jgi:hypothetical protein
MRDNFHRLTSTDRPTACPESRGFGRATCSGQRRAAATDIPRCTAAEAPGELKPEGKDSIRREHAVLGLPAAMRPEAGRALRRGVGQVPEDRG